MSFVSPINDSNFVATKTFVAHCVLIKLTQKDCKVQNGLETDSECLYIGFELFTINSKCCFLNMTQLLFVLFELCQIILLLYADDDSEVIFYEIVCSLKKNSNYIFNPRFL